jgi:glucose/arabinose dehydrogenase
MRGTTLGLGLVLSSFAGLAGCGGGSAADAPPGGDDDGPPPQIDAPPRPDAPMATCTVNNGTTVDLEELPGLDNLDDAPMLVTSPPDDRRLFIVNRNGVVQIYVDGAILPTPFIDVNPETNGGGESGLLGLAFHPNYGLNRKFYVFYTSSSGGLTHEVVEYQASVANANVADTATLRSIISIPDQAGNHNGGMIEFGNDGYLYISVGDGGPQDDPGGDAMNVNANLLGKILRIDIDDTSSGPYGIPDGNPFMLGGGLPEIYLYGMRNPWRFSFDRVTGDMYVGDVGQNQYEEITVITPAQQAGADLGWSRCEGLHPHTTTNVGDPPQTVPGSCTEPGQINAHAEHSHGSGFNAIIGGQVYRGTCFPALVGRYFYSDHGANELWSFTWNGTSAQNITNVMDTPGGPASLHADAFGELYLTTADGGPASIYRIIAR